MAKKRLKSKKKATEKAVKPNVPVGKYVLSIVGVVCIAFCWLLLTDISASVREAESFKQKGHAYLKKKKFRAAHRSFDQALAIAKKNNFMDRKPSVLAAILTGKADTYGTAAVAKGLYHENVPKAVDFFWQAHRITKKVSTLGAIAQLHAAAGNYKEQANVSQQILDLLIAHPQKAMQFGPKPIPGRPQDAKQVRNEVASLLRLLLSDLMISLRGMGKADLAASYFWKMKDVFPQYITWKHTYQTPYSEYIAHEDLHDKPFWEATGAWRREFEKHYKDILGELKRFLAKDGQFKLGSDYDLVAKREGEEKKSKDDWSEVLLWDRYFTEHCHSFPITCSLAHAIPQITGTDPGGRYVNGQVTILKLRPGTHLVPHVGASNVRLTNHLGLIIPKGLSLRVANETRGWKQGKIIVFDDSFEHEVWHNGTEDRYVLYISSWKKEFGEMTPNRDKQFWREA